MATDGDGLSDERERAIDEFLDDWLIETDVPGASVAVFDRDGVRYANGLGARSLDPTEPVTPDTLGNAGSISKVVTAIAVLQLVEDGAVALDDEVRDHVDFLADAPGDPITVRELLTHSSGMPADFIPERDAIADRGDLARHVDRAADRRIPGEKRFMYYNSGFVVLGELVAAVDGRSFGTYANDEVLEPLGMERSTFDQSVLLEDDDATLGFRIEDGEPVPNGDLLEFSTQPAAGGLVSTATELSRLGRCLVNGGEVDGTRVLDADTVDEACSHQATMATTVDGTERGYGYGTMVQEFLGESLAGHGGTVSVGQAYAAGLRDRGLGVAVTFDAAGLPAGDVGRGVLAIAAGETPAEVVPGLGIRESVEAVTGTYEGYRGNGTAHVEADGARIAVSFDDWGIEFPAFPENADPDDHSFYTVEENGDRSPVEFRETDEGTTMLYARTRLDRE